MAVDTFTEKHCKKPSGSKINSSIETYREPIVSLLGYNLFKEDYDNLEEGDTVENLINRFVSDNSENQRGLTEWFNHHMYKSEDEITIGSFMEELDNYRKELDGYGVDTEWLDEIISGNKILRLCSITEEGKERLKERYKLSKLKDLFVEDKNKVIARKYKEKYKDKDMEAKAEYMVMEYKDTLKFWFKGENCGDETEMTVEFFLLNLFRIKDRLITNEKGTGWIDRIIGNVRKYVLYGEISGDIS